MLLTQLGTWHSQERKTHIVAVFVGDVGGGGGGGWGGGGGGGIAEAETRRSWVEVISRGFAIDKRQLSQAPAC